MSVIAKQVDGNGYYIKETVVGIYIKESSDRLPGAEIRFTADPAYAQRFANQTAINTYCALRGGGYLIGTFVALDQPNTPT